jgi:hypothetical protein
MGMFTRLALGKRVKRRLISPSAADAFADPAILARRSADDVMPDEVAEGVGAKGSGAACALLGVKTVRTDGTYFGIAAGRVAGDAAALATGWTEG